MPNCRAMCSMPKSRDPRGWGRPARKCARPIAKAEGSADLRSRFDAVLLACGHADASWRPAGGCRFRNGALRSTPRTFETGTPGVFAGGSAIRGKTIVVRSVADGKEAAAAIDQFLCGLPVDRPTDAV